MILFLASRPVVPRPTHSGTTPPHRRSPLTTLAAFVRRLRAWNRARVAEPTPQPRGSRSMRR
ncbi:MULTISPECIES: hypothetical protein [Streptomyces]|uniref:hypothetical protein n=1 Tax=Streptomyces lycopersici TaxID=2974589 RepID=UPI0021CEE424|nr:hypothetical protein [Streptomyces sp. NEAU-383]